MPDALIIPRYIYQQFDHAGEQGFLPVFQEETKRQGETTAQGLAIGSRETNMRNIRGDFRGGKYHGFGIMQVDAGTDPEFARTWTSGNFAPGIVRGMEIYAKKREQIWKGQGQELRVFSSRSQRWTTFRGRAVDRDDTRRLTASAYNCGLWAYYAFSVNKHADSFTTGQDYGADVYFRALCFAKLLEDAKIEPDAFRREVIAQGEYCLAKYQRLAGVNPTPDTRETKAREVWNLPVPPDKATPEIMEPEPVQVAPVPSPGSSEPALVPVQAPTTQPQGFHLPPVRVLLQSLKEGYEAAATATGLTLAGLYGAWQAHKELFIVLTMVGLVVIYLNRAQIRYRLDKQVIDTAADPTKQTVQAAGRSAQTKAEGGQS